MKEWCPHISWGVTQTSMDWIISPGFRVWDTWKRCPICGAKRPEEPKKLWEKFAECPHWGHGGFHKELAKTAIEAVKEEMDEISLTFFHGSGEKIPQTALAFRCELKKRLDALL